MLLNIIYGCVSIILLIGFNIFILLKGKDLIITEDFDDSNQFYFFGKQFIINKIFTLLSLLLIGAIILWLGSDLLIKSSKDIATIFGISDRVISITLVALGTSLPELFASVYAASKSETKLSTNNPSQEEGEDSISCSYSGDEMEIGFNLTYLIEVIDVISSENVVLQLNNSDSGCLISSNNESALNKYIIMPMRV